MAENRHQSLVRLGRRSRIFNDDIRLVHEEVGRSRLDAALLAPRHRMPRDVVDACRQDILDMLPQICLRASCIRQNGAFFEMRQDFFKHRHHLQHGRRQEDDVSIYDDRLHIGGRHVDGAAFQSKIHGFLRAAKSRDEDIIAELFLQAEPQGSADKTDADDCKLRLHASRPMKRAMFRTSSIVFWKFSGVRD